MNGRGLRRHPGGLQTERELKPAHEVQRIFVKCLLVLRHGLLYPANGQQVKHGCETDDRRHRIAAPRQTKESLGLRPVVIVDGGHGTQQRVCLRQ